MKGLKTLGCLLALLLAAVILFPAKAEAADVEINESTFPDDGFRDFVHEQYDLNGDWVLSASEIKKVDYITYCEHSCKDLTGIEYFIYLKELYCYDNKLSSLDVSKLTKLVWLDCNDNNLSTLNVSKNTALQFLNCGKNNLTKLDVSKNLKLRRLWCYDNKLTKLDVSKNTALAKLYCDENNLTALDISNNPNIGELDCADNKLTKLDLSKNTGIFSLSCQGNSITKVDIHYSEFLMDAYVKDHEPRESDDAIYYIYEDYSIWDPDELEEEESDSGLCSFLGVDKTTTIICRPKITSPVKITKKTVNSGDKVSLKVKTVSSTSMTYQWYWRKGTSGSWTKVTAASGTKATYTFTAKDKHNGYQYMCRVKNTYGSTNCKVFKLTVKPLPKITSPTKATTKTVSKGKTATFKVTATGAAKYQWYYRTSKTGSWKMVKASSGKTATYKLYNTAAKYNGYQYRCKVYNATDGYVYSKIFTLKVTS